MMPDPQNKNPRTFQCRDYLWEAFEAIAQEMDCTTDSLVNEAMRVYLQSKSRGGPMADIPEPLEPRAGGGFRAPGMGQNMGPGGMPGMPRPGGMQGPPGMPGAQRPQGMPGQPPPMPGQMGQMGQGQMGQGQMGQMGQGQMGQGQMGQGQMGQGQMGQGQMGQMPRPGMPSMNQGQQPGGMPGQRLPPLGQQQGGLPPMNPNAQRPAGPPGGMPGQAPMMGGGPPRPQPPMPGAPPPMGPPGMGGPGQMTAQRPMNPQPMGPPPQMAQPMAPPRPPAPGRQSGTLVAIYEGQQYPVTKEEFVIGRGQKTSDLTIRDSNVSRRHACVVLYNGQYWIVDQQSTNGVEYNGTKVDKKVVEHGDLFRICDHEIQFVYR